MTRFAWPLLAFLILLAAAIGVGIFGPTHDKTSFWINFWTALNALSILATLFVVAYYTYETYQLRLAAVFSNRISFRPIVTFDASKPHYEVVNKGNGPALNTCLITWTNKQLHVVPETDVPGVIPPSSGYQFNSNTLYAVDASALRSLLPQAGKTVDRITSRNYNLFCVTYADLEGIRYFSITNGSNGLMEHVFEHGRCAEA